MLLMEAELGVPPGGHMEYGEKFFETGARETKEETNLDVSGGKLLVSLMTFIQKKQNIT